MKIVLGAVISLPPISAGCAWNRLQYLLGLRRLGHDVVFVEEVKPKWAVDAAGRQCAYQDSQNRRGFMDIMEQFELTEHCCQVYNAGEATTGLSRDAMHAFAASADLLIDISGHVTTESILDAPHRRAYLDQDPVFTQLWRAEYGKDLNLDHYDVFFTVGLNIGTPFSAIPDCGIDWHHTLPPVVPDLWKNRQDEALDPHAPFTTVASLYGYSDLCFRGEWYRTKNEEFRRFAELPVRSGQAFEVLVKEFREDDDNVRLLRANGWRVRKSAEMDLPAYRDYIAASRGEIGITKGAYVKGRSGWFSDRTASYLASGRPALAQSTGFEHCLPTGLGLLCFEDNDQAAAAVESINTRYPSHCRAAREFADQYLDYRKVLPAMLELATATAAPAATAVQLRNEGME
jgi:hypothetical protein